MIICPQKVLPIATEDLSTLQSSALWPYYCRPRSRVTTGAGGQEDSHRHGPPLAGRDDMRCTWCVLCLVTAAINPALGHTFGVTDLPTCKNQVSSRSRDDATYCRWTAVKLMDSWHKVPGPTGTRACTKLNLSGATRTPWPILMTHQIFLRLPVTLSYLLCAFYVYWINLNKPFTVRIQCKHKFTLSHLSWLN